VPKTGDGHNRDGADEGDRRERVEVLDDLGQDGWSVVGVRAGAVTTKQRVVIV
jgi:hypothetical protein